MGAFIGLCLIVVVTLFVGYAISRYYDKNINSRRWKHSNDEVSILDVTFD